MVELDAASAMRILLVVCLLWAMLLSCVYGLDIGIGVRESIKGAAFLNVTDNPVQKIQVLWSNTGSVDCVSRARIDFYKGTQRFRTVWGPSDIVPAGKERVWSVSYTHLTLPTKA